MFSFLWFAHLCVASRFVFELGDCVSARIVEKNKLFVPDWGGRGLPFSH